MSSKRKFQHFLSLKRGIIGSSIFVVICFFSFTAELWSNNKPLLLIHIEKNKSTYFFPLFKNYEPEIFGIEDSFIVDYKDLIKENKDYKSFFPLNPWNPEQQTDKILQAPSREHLLGTDHLGRDVFARLIYGVRISLSFALVLWFFSYFFGAIIGSLQGYLVGTFDFILERVKELASIIPMISAIILVTAMMQKQTFFLILFLVFIFAWMGIASQLRAGVLSLRKRDFCEAAQALGGTKFHVLFKHILPNCLTPLITLTPFAIEGGISLLATLDYLGFGLPPPTPSLGELMAQGRDNLQNAPWIIASPVLTILVLLIAISLIGQALRDVFDPRMQ